MVKKGLRVVSYGRVSRVAGRAGDSFMSPREQRERIEGWANANDATVIEHIEDLDVSGGTIEREGFQRALSLIEAGQADAIVTAKLDRFARSIPRAYEAIERIEAAGGTFVSVADQLDLSTPSGRLTFNMLASFAQFELERLQAGWRIAKADAIQRGVVIGPTPFGYSRAEVRNGRPAGGLVPNPDTAKIVKRAYELATEDVHAAMAFLADAAPDKPWTLWTTERLLRSPVYLGHAVYGDLMQEDAHEALVDGFTWRRVQYRIDERQGAVVPRAPAGTFPLTGHANCATCGGLLAGSRMGKDRRRSMRCTTNQRSNDATCERPATVSAEPLEARVHELLVDFAQQREAELEGLMAGVTGSELGAADVAPTTEAERVALAEAEQALADLEKLRDAMPAAAFEAAVRAQDTAVVTASAALANAELDAEGAEGPPEDAEIANADVSELGNFLERFGLRVVLKPGRGQLGERVTLERTP